ncbi:MAG: tetratricopeptide repeat protein, partial [Bacteroidota bacterium]
MKTLSPIVCILLCYLFPMVGEAQEDAWQLMRRGEALFQEKQYEQSRTFYDQAKALYIERNDWDSLTVASLAVIYTFIYERNLDATFKAFEQIFEHYSSRALAPSFYLAKAFALQAYVYNRKGNLSASLQAYEQAIDIYDELGTNHYHVAYIYRNAAMILMRRQDYQKTIRYLKTALQRDSTGEYKASIYSQLAHCNLYIPNVDETLKYCHLGIQYQQEKENYREKNRDLAFLQWIAGSAYLEQKNYVKADSLSKAALSFYQNGDSFWSYRMFIYISLAKLNQELKNDQRAEEYFQQAMAEKKAYAKYKDRDFASLYTAVSDFYFQTGHLDKALEYTQKALQQIFPKFNENNFLANPSLDAVYPEPWIMSVTDQKGKVLLALYQKN